MEITPALLSCPLFNGISRDNAEAVLTCLSAYLTKYKKGAAIFHPGDKAENAGILLSGLLTAAQTDFWGNRSLTAQIKPGGLFAEAFACAKNKTVSLTVTAEEASAVLWISPSKILRTCPASCPFHSVLSENLLMDLADKNLYLNQKIRHMGRRTTREKLLSYLSAESQRYGRNKFKIPFNREQLADYLCVERSAMSAELSRMKRDGLIAYRKNEFMLLSGVDDFFHP